MRMSFVLGEVVLATMALETGVASGMALARTQQCAVSRTRARSGDEDQHQQPVVDSTLDDGLPTGLTLTLLADKSTERWPAFAPGLALLDRRLRASAISPSVV